MSNNTKIFQIYFKPELKVHCDPAFTPLDNTDNPRPDLREWYVWDREYKNILEQNLDYWGFVSWKFKEKTNLTGEQALNFINTNPGYDVYLFNPCILNEACFSNSWEQGDIHHPNISDIGNSFLKKIGYKDIDVKYLNLDRDKMVFANYIVGSKKFWARFMPFVHQIFSEAESDPEFKHQVFGEGLSNYAHDRSLPNFTFLLERLIPTFLELEKISSIGFTYTEDTLPVKYQPYFDEIRVLSDLKMLINRHSSDHLDDVWNFYRHKFLHTNQGVLNLE